MAKLRVRHRHKNRNRQADKTSIARQRYKEIEKQADTGQKR